MIYGQLDTETQRVVQYGDLNLVNPTGQNRLFRRVGYAVDDLCGGTRSLAAVRENLEVRSCSKAAWSSANPQIAAAVDQAKSGNYISAAALTITSVR
jgi:UrcA family protein